ncbi:YciI family protein [Singulisphaera sp. Ch08]|uniref:YciI family protein n=1 Tax=Singulisphaera sp. Ch08 TaxID=3120278 RepID=A0AAU7CBQ9_9BACT
MRFMIIRKADKDTEAGVLPSEELLAAMVKYNEELVRAGVLLAGEGLQPSAKGARVKFSGGKPSVIDGPFAETKELVAGFTMIEVKSKEEALEWVKRWPALDGNGEVEIELRQIYEAADFGAEFTPELREAEERMRDQLLQSGKPLDAKP